VPVQFICVSHIDSITLTYLLKCYLSHSHQHAAATSKQPTDAEKEDDKAEQDEKLAENDDEEALRRQRDWDEWRDGITCLEALHLG